MKIAFDENVPLGMVRVFEALAREKRFRRELEGCEIVSAKDYTPSPKDKDYVRRSDVPWLTRFAEDGGRVVISGDTRMPDVPHELFALQQHGFVCIFFENKWNQFDFFRKSALLLSYWKLIVQTVKSAPIGTLFRVPNDFGKSASLREISASAREMKATRAKQSKNEPRDRKVHIPAEGSHKQKGDLFQTLDQPNGGEDEEP